LRLLYAGVYVPYEHVNLFVQLSAQSGVHPLVKSGHSEYIHRAQQGYREKVELTEHVRQIQFRQGVSAQFSGDTVFARVGKGRQALWEWCVSVGGRRSVFSHGCSS
jgi:hypothetical protein